MCVAMQTNIQGVLTPKPPQYSVKEMWERVSKLIQTASYMGNEAAHSKVALILLAYLPNNHILACLPNAHILFPFA